MISPAFTTAPSSPLDAESMQNLNILNTVSFIREHCNVDLLQEYGPVDEDEKSKTRYLIVGDVQSGKTKTLLCHALMSIVFGVKVVIIVRNNTVDVTQLMRSCKNIAEKHSQRVGAACETIIPGDVEKIDDWFSSDEDTTNFLVLLANGSQFKKFEDKWNVKEQAATRRGRRFELPYTFIVDEADQSLMTEGKNLAPRMERVLNRANMVFAVTATPKGIMNMEDFARVKNILKVRIPSGAKYHGFNELKHYVTDNRAGTGDNIVDKNDPIKTIIGLLDQEDYMNKYNQPIIFLPKVDRKIDNHEFIAEFLHLNTRNKWATVMFNGKGVTIEHTNLDEDDMFIERTRGKKVKMIEGKEVQPNAFFFSGCDITQALSLLRRLQEQLQLTHIAIIAGELADRGVNFVDDSYSWHISHQYIEVAKSAFLSSLIQGLRICGIHKDDMPLSLFCSQQNYTDLKKEYDGLREFLSAMENEEHDLTMDEFMDNTTIHVSRKTKRKACKNDTRIGFTRRSADDNLTRLEAPSRQAPVIINNYATTNVIMPGANVPNSGATDEEREQLDEFVVKGLEKIKKSYDMQTGHIYRILKHFEEIGFDSDTSRIAIEQLHAKIKVSNYTEWSRLRNKVLIKSDGGYILNPVVKEHLGL